MGYTRGVSEELWGLFFFHSDVHSSRNKNTEKIQTKSRKSMFGLTRLEDWSFPKWRITFELFSRSDCGNLQWNYPYPQDVHEPMQIGERWPAHCVPESRCFKPTTPILGPEDPRYKHLVQISSVFIVTQNTYREPNIHSPTSRDNAAVRQSSYLQPFQQSNRMDYSQTTLVMPVSNSSLLLMSKLKFYGSKHVNTLF